MNILHYHNEISEYLPSSQIAVEILYQLPEKQRGHLNRYFETYQIQQHRWHSNNS